MFRGFRVFDSWSLTLTGFYVVLAGGSTWLIITRGSLGLQASLLPIVGGFFLYGLLRLVRLAVPMLPLGHCKRFSVAIGLCASGILLALEGRPIAVIALGWLLVAFGARGALTALQYVIIERGVFASLKRDFARGTSPSLPVPYVFVLAEPGFGVNLAHRFVSAVSRRLWEYHYLSANSGLSVYAGRNKKGYLWRHRQRGMVYFLVSESLRGQSEAFLHWLVSHSSAFIDFFITDSDSNVLDDKIFLSRADGFRICLGPTFRLQVSSVKTEGDTLGGADITMRGHWSLSSRPLGDLIPRFSTRMANNVLPLAASDLALPEDARVTSQSLAYRGLPPVANAYLRFRLAQSDVERFLCLLDCVEALLRCSVIALLSCSSDNLRMESAASFHARPTLGSWVRLLASLLEHSSTDWISRVISSSWVGEITREHLRLVQRVENSSLKGLELTGRRRVDWFEWLVALRNVTRGHGVITESGLAPFWHDLRLLFLENVQHLAPFVLESRLLCADRPAIEVRGWQRGAASLEGLASDKSMCPMLLATPQRQHHPVSPLIVARDGHVLVFDHILVRKASVVYYDYLTGERLLGGAATSIDSLLRRQQRVYEKDRSDP